MDIDADGDQDLFIGESSGAINFYRNVGTPSSPNFEFVSDKFSGIDIGRRSVPTFADLDQDGDQDLFVGSRTSNPSTTRTKGGGKTAEDAEGPGALPAP